MGEDGEWEFHSELYKLPKGPMIPTRNLLTAVHDEVISDSVKTTNVGHHGIRDDSILDYLCYKLGEHKYKEDQISNAYYIGTETFFIIACRHPFIDGNKRTAYASSTLVVFANLSETLGVGSTMKMTEEGNAGEIIETIARWGEGSDSSSLEELAFNAGIFGKRRREMNEEDVKRFINKFLRNTIQIDEADANG